VRRADDAGAVLLGDGVQLGRARPLEPAGGGGDRLPRRHLEEGAFLDLEQEGPSLDARHPC